MASGADHIDHVRTQLPYALMVGIICIPAYVMAGFGLSIWLTWPLFLAILVGAFLTIGKRSSPAGP